MESATACPVCTLYLREGISLYDHLDTHPKDQVIEALIRIRERDESIPPTPQPLLSIPTSQSASYYQSPQPCYPVQQYSTNSYAYQQMAMMGTSSIPPHLGPVAMVMPPSTPTPNLMQVMYNPYMLPQQNIHMLSPPNRPAPASSPILHDSLMVVPKESNSVHLTSESVQTNLSIDSNTFHLHPPPIEPRKRQSSPIPLGFIPPLPPTQIVRPVATYDEGRTEYRSEEIQEPLSITLPLHTDETLRTSPPRRLSDEFVQTESVRRVRFVQYKLSSERIARSSRETAETCIVETDKEWSAAPHFAPAAPSGLHELIVASSVKLTPVDVPCADTPVRSKRARTRTPRATRSKALVPATSLPVNSEFYLSQPGSSRLEPIASVESVDHPPSLKLDQSDDEVPADRKSDVDPLLSRELGYGESSDPACPMHSQHEGSPAFRGHEPDDPAFRGLSVHEQNNFNFRRLSQDNPNFRRLSVHEPSESDFRRLSVHEPDESDFGRLPVHETEDPLEVRTAVDSIVMPDDEYITSDCPFGIRKTHFEPEAGSEPPLGEEYDTSFVGECLARTRAVETLAYVENSQGSDAYPVHAELEAGIKPKVLKQQIDDLNVSTSYEVLAREGWAVSDCSDAESAAPRSEGPWMAPPDLGKRPYKCALCGETFNCPKERRVHRTAYHSARPRAVGGTPPPPPPEPAAEPPPLKTERSLRPRPAKKKRVMKAVQVLVVQSASDKFTGVFVKEDGLEVPLEVDEIKKEATQTIAEAMPPIAGGSVAKGAAAKGAAAKGAVAKVAKRVKRATPSAARAPRGGPYKCSSCPLQFPLRRKYLLHVQKEHMNTMSLKNPYICNICQEVFTNDRRYSEHLQKHPLECKTCCKVFHRRQNLVLHMRRHLGIKPFPCNMCAKSFITKQKLNEHKNVHLGLAPIKCTLCTMAFRRYSNLIQHKNRFHYMIKKKVKDYVCFCGEIYHSKKKLEWHKEIHEKKPKCCKFCSERFVHTASLTRHIRRAHDRRYMPKVGRETENVECAVCGHVFLKSSLMVHMRLHTGERPYSCSVCGKNFTTKWNLQQHRWTHMSRSSKPFKCSQCKSAFARESDYSQHMDSHSNKRPYTCNVCGLQFVRKNNCIRHAKEHQAVKTFTCKVCSKSFHRGYYLKDHMMVHSGARPFTCHICGKASSTKSNHNKHVKIHHAREPVNTEA